MKIWATAPLNFSAAARSRLGRHRSTPCPIAAFNRNDGSGRRRERSPISAKFALPVAGLRRRHAKAQTSGNPPRSTRHPPGVSGNPNGRPRRKGEARSPAASYPGASPQGPRAPTPASADRGRRPVERGPAKFARCQRSPTSLSRVGWSMETSFARQFPPYIIRHAVWLDLRFALSFLDVV
jgi:hypothetical protein